MTCMLSNCSLVTHKKCQYEWKIKDFNNCKTFGQFIKSPIFSYNTDKGKTKWRLKVYPYGDTEKDNGYLSLYLESMNDSSLTIIRSYSFNFLHVNKQIKMFSTTFKSREILGRRQFIENTEIFNLLQTSCDDLMIFCCEISSVTISNLSSHTQIISPKKEMVKDISQLLKDKDLSDLKLIVGTKEFQVHKAILAARSTVFAAMFKHDMTEKRTSQVEIQDVEPRVFEVFLKFIYTSDVEITYDIAKDLLIVADKYAVERLKNLCISKLCLMINRDNAVQMLIFADLYMIIELKDLAINFIITCDKEIIDLPHLKSLEERPYMLAELLQKAILQKK